MQKPSFIKIGGKERRLRYDINAGAEMEELLSGQSLLWIMHNPNAVGFRVLRVLLWGGLKHAEKGLTLQRVGMMIQEFYEDGGTMEELLEVIGKALRASKIIGNVTEEPADEDGEEGKNE